MVPRLRARARSVISAVLFLLVLAPFSGIRSEESNAEKKGFSFTAREGELDVLSAGRPIARWMYAHDASTPEKRHDTYKPYLHVLDPDSGKPITKGPGGLYTHHRAIFLGWNKVSSATGERDFWHMKQTNQIQRELTKKEASSDRAVISARIDWVDEKSDVWIGEERTLTFHAVAAPYIASIDVETRLTAQRDLRLDGDPEHAGVQYRPADEVDKKATGYLFPKEDADPRKDRDYPWVGEAYKLGGETYGVVEMSDPHNPDGGIWSAYRDYGRFGELVKKELAKGETLTLRYRFLVREGGLPETAEIQRRYDEFAKLDAPSPVPATTTTAGLAK